MKDTETAAIPTDEHMKGYRLHNCHGTDTVVMLKNNAQKTRSTAQCEKGGRDCKQGCRAAAQRTQPEPQRNFDRVSGYKTFRTI